MIVSSLVMEVSLQPENILLDVSENENKESGPYLNEKYRKSEGQSFIKNEGQLRDEKIRFYSSSINCSVGFRESEVFFSKYDPSVGTIEYTMTFVGSNMVEPEGEGRTQGVTNYYMGNISITDISSFQEVWYHNIYEDIDMRYYFSHGFLKYEFHVAPRGNPSNIQIEMSDNLHLSITHEIVKGISQDFSSFVCFEEKGLTVHDIHGTKVESKFRKIDGNVYGYDIEVYGFSKSLVIDPWIVSFGTRLGGTETEGAGDIDRDQIGSLYITGYTYGGFPLKNPYQSSWNGSTDVFVAKLDSDNGLIFSTYIGGNESDSARGIAVDSTGNSYVTGHTRSPNFPTLNAFNETYSETTDSFLFKLDGMGQLVYSTYFGGNGSDVANAIDVDGVGNAYICGVTYSHNLPTCNAFMDSYTPGHWAGDAFIAKFNPAGESLNFSTYIGGSWKDEAYDLVVDNNGYSYVVGMVNSIDFPTTSGAFDPSYNGDGESFVLKLNETGNGLEYCSFLGGTDHEWALAVDVDAEGYCYTTGWTDSEDFPVKNAAFSTNFSSGQVNDVFITKFNTNGSDLVYSTYMGGTDYERAYDIKTQENGRCFVAGYTKSDDFHIVNTSHSTHYGSQCGFIALLNSTGSGFIFSSYLEVNGVQGITLASNGECYLYGSTYFTSFPARDEIPEANDAGNVFLIRMGFSDDCTSPTVVGSDDIEIAAGTEGVSINWTATDLNPESYEISRNGTIVKEGKWNESGEVVSLTLSSGLCPATFNYTITATDSGWNTASDSILVTVVDDTTTTTVTTTTETSTSTTTNESITTTTSTLDYGHLIMVGIGVIGVVIIISVIMLRRK
jgi:hypothetical protein